MAERKRYVESAFTPDEAAPYAKAFGEIVRTRRSVRVFDGTPIPEATMRECLRLALLAPNSSNLQPWEFHWVRNAELKQALGPMCLSQKAASTAAELVVCVARRDKWKSAARELMRMFDEADRTTPYKTPPIVRLYYGKLVYFTYQQGWFGLFGWIKKLIFFSIGLFRPITRRPSSIADMRVWATKTTALGCENLMLALRAHGFDSCPMEGIDESRIKRLLGLPCRAEVVMVIGAGKRAVHGVYAPQMRFDEKMHVVEHV